MKMTIEGKRCEIERGDTVLDTARRAGIEIPAVCAHDALEPYGACRLCVVEVRKKGTRRWRIVTSCLYEAQEGLEVKTGTERIKRYRRLLLELMLARSSTTPYVRRLAKEYGVTRTRFAKGDDDCIMCGLCVRICSEVVGANAIGFAYRGITRKIDVPFGIDASRCIACGACTWLCPTGAVQMEYERAIELRKQLGEHLCRYAMMGLISDASCSMNYECARCEVDQRMRDEYGTHPVIAVRKMGSGKKTKRR